MIYVEAEVRFISLFQIETIVVKDYQWKDVPLE